jgi:hypothetical protein
MFFFILPPKKTDEGLKLDVNVVITQKFSASSQFLFFITKNISRTFSASLSDDINLPFFFLVDK